MKKLILPLLVIVAFLTTTLTVQSANVSLNWIWDTVTNVLQPAQNAATSTIKVNNITSTSTTQTNTFPLITTTRATTTGLTITGVASQPCIGTNAAGVVQAGTCSGGAGTSTVYVSTTTVNTGDVAFISGPGSIGSVATGTISTDANFTVTANRSTIGGATAIGLATGLTIPTTTGLQTLYASSHNPVTLAGAGSYLSILGQVITQALINLGTQVSGVLAVLNGGTGTSTVPTTGQVLVGQANGTYAPQATSTLGISGGAGTNYLTNSGLNTFLNTGTNLQATSVQIGSSSAAWKLSSSTLSANTLLVSNNGYPSVIVGADDAAPIANFEINSQAQGNYTFFGMKNGGYSGAVGLDVASNLGGITQNVVLKSNTAGGAGVMIPVTGGNATAILRTYNNLGAIFNVTQPYNAGGTEANLSTTIVDSAGNNNTLDVGLQEYPGTFTTGRQMYMHTLASGFAVPMPTWSLGFWQQGYGDTSNSTSSWGFLSASSSGNTKDSTSVVVLGDAWNNGYAKGAGVVDYGPRGVSDNTGATVQVVSSSSRIKALEVFNRNGNTFNTLLTVANSGNIGIGTSTPTVKLDVAGSYPTARITNYTGSQYAGSRLWLGNTANTLGNQAGTNLYSGINDAGLTQGYFSMEQANVAGGAVNRILFTDYNAQTTDLYSGGVSKVTINNAGVTIPAIKLSAVRDNANSLGSNGMLLQSNGATASWVATSSLGISGGSGSGTVTSVSMTVPTGLSVSGSPITTAGTLGLTYTAGYEGLLSASSSNYNSFFTTPSTRIIAGTGLSWAGNTLNAAAGTNYLTNSGVNTYLNTGTNLQAPTFQATSTTGTSTFAGRVGIGTTTPNGIVDIVGSSSNTSLIAFDPNRSLSVVNTDLTSGNVQGVTLRSLSNNGTLQSGAKLLAVNTARSAAGLTSDLAILTNNDGTVSEKMRVMSNGNVGIGTSTPATALSVVGTTTLATTTVASLTVLGTTTTTGLSVGSLTGFLKATAGAVATSLINLATDVSGILGFTNGGTGQSTYATGDTLYASAVNTLAKRTIGNLGDVLSVAGGVPVWVATSTLGFGAGGSASGTVNTGTIGQQAYYAANGNAISGTSTIFTVGEKVGIGSTSPSSKLTISDSSGNGNTGLRIENLGAASFASPSVTLSNIDGVTSVLQLFNSSNATFPSQTQLYSTATSGLSFRTINAATANILFYTNNTNERMRIDVNGNVGIGTSSPISTLAVTGTTSVQNLRIYGLPGSRALFLRADGSATTTAPSADLASALSDETGTGVAVFGTAPSFTTSITTPSVINAGTLSLSATGANIISFLTNSIARMTITAAGNVGIGTTTPIAALQLGTSSAMAFGDNTIASSSGIMIIQDQKASGTLGGTSTAGVNTRVLNTVLVNTIPGASLASNQVTLPAGYYEIEASAPAFAVDRHRTLWFNITNNATTSQGMPAFSDSAAGNTMSDSHIMGYFVATSTNVFELREYMQSARNANGFGLAMTQGTETYSTVTLRKR